jgi:predicted GH43/DUF377 family glycosyl hydrolase
LASTEDFSQFEKHGVIGPDLNDKDCVLFPEPVDGRFALLHRVEGKIQIAYFDSIESLENSQKYWQTYLRNLEPFEIMRPRFYWETRKVGAGPSPIKTSKGWLVIYHGVNAERAYSAGAVLLDLDNPVKVIARTKEPILQPETEFEREGVVPNVVFPDGAVLHDGELLVYYGAADRVCCVASTPFEVFLEELTKEKP